MKNIYAILACCFIILMSCSSPAKKQHQDKARTINDLQNVGSGASDDTDNNIASGKLTDSTNTDTSGNTKTGK